MADTRRRAQIFALSWLAYAAFYLCRKNFSVIMPLLAKQNGFSNELLSSILLAFSLAYTLGQFIMGIAADAFGARRVVTAGMLVSAAAMAAIGFQNSSEWFWGLQIVNGLAQATGWSALSKIMATWFERTQRGVAMAWWSTNYVAGGYLATVIATWAATSAFFPAFGWRRAAWIPAGLLAVMALVFAVLVRDTTALTGVPRTDRPARARTSFGKAAQVFRRPCVRILAVAYFLVKFVRYSLLFWLPLYLTQHGGFNIREAGYMSAWFEFAGIAGVLAAGYLSDRVFQSRRFPVGAIMLMALAIVSLLPAIQVRGVSATAIEIALIGIVTYGPDTLISGAATQDSSSADEVATAAGIVDGFGSSGQLLSTVAISAIVSWFGWPAIFVAFSVAAGIAGLLLLVGARWERSAYPAALRDMQHNVILLT